ncbi:hypothetical protein CY34DRAFT_808306 [Suillus luteus UH-Slu-Lm8-n1]|uniref:Uncharacterized protein n=1 Tax=Suillus luteus UH-Slu-Lm8-n1 TaxID=930992 RepID=A0A0D0AMZ6_9AGAM|nr:hypothetical protein CY34DRAFT_808306 [Suillus luteus UH-Slu-Lm8-n1]
MYIHYRLVLHDVLSNHSRSIKYPEDFLTANHMVLIFLHDPMPMRRCPNHASFTGFETSCQTKWYADRAGRSGSRRPICQRETQERVSRRKTEANPEKFGCEQFTTSQ